MLTGHSSMSRSAEKRARIMSSLGTVVRTRSVYFVEERGKRDAIERTAIVGCDELERIDDPEDVRELIRERTDPVEPEA
jgi:putative transcriptional regulator